VKLALANQFFKLYFTATLGQHSACKICRIRDPSWHSSFILRLIDSFFNKAVEHGTASRRLTEYAVLQAPEENRNHTIACHILPDSLLQVYICLVQKKNGIPNVRQLKNTRQSLFENVGLETEFTGRNLRR
jgi:hypothetical protein